MERMQRHLVEAKRWLDSECLRIQRMKTAMVDLCDASTETSREVFGVSVEVQTRPPPSTADSATQTEGGGVYTRQELMELLAPALVELKLK
jgi:hypothetical protein